VRAFVPLPLPPDPPVDLSGLHAELEIANQALGRLDGISSVLPDPPLFLYMYVRKEALLSSQIDGTQSSLANLLLFEADEAPASRSSMPPRSRTTSPPWTTACSGCAADSPCHCA
jgi:Fic family protein